MTKTAKEYLGELITNTDALYSDQVTYVAFTDIQKAIWRNIRAAGRPMELQVASLLYRARMGEAVG